MVEHRLHTAGVTGSNPVATTTNSRKHLMGAFVFKAQSGPCTPKVCTARVCDHVYMLNLIRVTMKTTQLHVASALQKLCAIVVLVCCALLVVVSLAPQRAFADGPSYTFDLQVQGEAPQVLQAGDTFTVSGVLERSDQSSFPMYAISATIRFNSDMFELVESSAYSDVVVTQNALSGSWQGYTDIVCNVMSMSTNGKTWEGPVDFVTFTLKAKEAGSSFIAVRRVNISNSSGMGSYACDCSDLSVRVVSEAPEEGSSAANSPAISTASTESAGTTEAKDNSSAGTSSESSDASGNAGFDAAVSGNGDSVSAITDDGKNESELLANAQSQAKTINFGLVAAIVGVVIVLLIVVIVVLVKKIHKSNVEELEELAQAGTRMNQLQTNKGKQGNLPKR